MTEATTDPAPGQEKRVSAAELFFDLVFVFAVTEVSTRLTEDKGGLGLLRSLVVFVPIYWLWVGTSLQANLRDINRPVLRLTVFGVGLTSLFLALAVPYAFETQAILFACCYWIGRLLLGVPLLVQYGWQWNPYSVSITMTAPALVVGALLPSGWQLAIWGCAAVLDLSTPTLFARRLRGLRYDAGHLAERFGSFVLIALGESVVAIGASAHDPRRLSFATGCAVAAAFALSCGLWWVYFQYAADAVRYALATAQVQLDITRAVLSYGHLSFIASIIAVAVGLRSVVEHPTSALGWGPAGFLFGGCTLFLATFGYTRWRMFRLMSTTRLATAAVVLVLLPAAALVPALAATAVLAVVVAGLNAIEWYRVTHTGSVGTRDRLRRRPAAPAAPT